MFIIIVLYNEPPPAPLLYQPGVSWVLCVELNRMDVVVSWVLLYSSTEWVHILRAVCIELNIISEFSFGCRMSGVSAGAVCKV